MRCKKGDLVRMVRCHFPENIDHIGQIIEGPNSDYYCWKVQFPTPLRASVAGTYTLGSSSVGWAADDQLQPIDHCGLTEEEAKELEKQL